jgi:arylformamidase
MTAPARAGAESAPRLDLSTLVDASRPLREGMEVWPGDAPFRRLASSSGSAGDSVTVSRLTLSAHSGTHADAPLHVEAGAGGAETLEPWRFVGPALLIDARGRQALGEELVPGEALESGVRLLFRTDYTAGGGSPPGEYGPHIPFLAPTLARRLAKAGVPLVGVDGPSVDPFQSTALEAHSILAAGGVAILEHLDLTRAEPGEWFLIALPLLLPGSDAAPVRAVLVKALR